MDFYIDSSGHYYEGDQQGTDKAVPQRPTPLHTWQGGDWVLDWQRVSAMHAATIDAKAAAIYAHWTRFEAEYRAREVAAQAFADAGYLGDPGLYVTSFAEPAGLTAHAATDAILAQAAALRVAQDALAALRMRKYEIARAVDAESAQVLADEIVAAMDEIMRRIG